jgi:hypothetical protein
MDFIDYKEELRKREFNFKCKVVRKTVHIDDDAYDQSSGFNRADLVMLIPYEGTERDLFMSAFYEDAYPRKNGEGRLSSKVEIPSFIGSPCSMPSMLRLCWPTQYYEHPHLLVMSVSMEALLNNYKNIDSIEIRTFPYDKIEELGLTDGVVRV